MSERLWIYPLIAVAAYIALSVYVLWTGHPHEDAYILYIFSENFAAGEGISYFKGGPPAEGATDFLWMIALGVLTYAGIDVALAATILNGVGVGILVFALSLFLPLRQLGNRLSHVIMLGVAVIVILSPITEASLAGFSTGLYSGIIALFLYIIYRNNDNLNLLIPFIGLVLGLFRPDGVIIGVSGALVGLLNSYKNEGLNVYLKSSAICFVLGCFYFFWRYNYFGSLLPLPLYVKGSSSDLLPGLASHFKWVGQSAFLVIMAMLAIFLSNNRRNIVLMITPVLLLFFFLSFATLSQNVSYRLQAPGTVAVLVLATLFVSYCLASKSKNKKLSVVMLGLYVFSILQYLDDTVDYVHYAQGGAYINSFPFYLKDYASSSTVSGLTEAGRFAYWLPGEKYDLVGLNTKKTAIEGASPQYISKLDPDLLFMHHAGTAEFSNVCNNKKWCQITSEELFSSIEAEKAGVWDEYNYGVKRAPLAIFDFLGSSKNRFDYYVMYYEGGFNHFYALKKSGEIENFQFEKALSKSFQDKNGRSYLDLKNAF
ncbi:hypothetical protein [Halospina sp. K52047b]|uniref:hypothetical protein n=1 Tax=Halospina sp. K52047b TaxID=2614160 RepID=UPI001249E739|nr:hypothetical protein [Halospina sp. K52047b]KAA8981268.1 hypothetical protein F3089_10190 [Halospina sp. K52047b]